MPLIFFYVRRRELIFLARWVKSLLFAKRFVPLYIVISPVLNSSNNNITHKSDTTNDASFVHGEWLPRSETHNLRIHRAFKVKFRSEHALWRRHENTKVHLRATVHINLEPLHWNNRARKHVRVFTTRKSGGDSRQCRRRHAWTVSRRLTNVKVGRESFLEE